jgi:hypothetical protein
VRDKCSSLFVFIVGDEENCFLTLTTGVNALKHSSLMNVLNKLEHLVTGKPFDPDLIRLGTYHRGKQLSIVPSRGGSWNGNVIIGWKVIPGRNALAYLSSYLATKKKSFTTLARLLNAMARLFGSLML